MPYTMWTVTADGEALMGVRAGSPVGYLAYSLVLCGLAVWAAVMRDAEGAARARWARRGTVLAVAAVGTYLWALLG
jgi:hypothetical protein